VGLTKAVIRLVRGERETWVRVRVNGREAEPAGTVGAPMHVALVSAEELGDALSDVRSRIGPEWTMRQELDGALRQSGGWNGIDADQREFLLRGLVNAIMPPDDLRHEPLFGTVGAPTLR
jgi:hypothetical protein